MTTQTPGHRPRWVDDELFPFASKFINVDGHAIHYIDEGQGPLLLLYHGTPTWSFVYRRLIVSLPEHVGVERNAPVPAAPYPNPVSRRPCHVLPREITRAKQLLRDVGAGLSQLAHLPALIIWADRDFAFRKRDLARWESIFSDHQTHVLHGAGHFFQDDAAPEVANVLADWMAANS